MSIFDYYQTEAQRQELRETQKQIRKLSRHKNHKSMTFVSI